MDDKTKKQIFMILDQLELEARKSHNRTDFLDWCEAWTIYYLRKAREKINLL